MRNLLIRPKNSFIDNRIVRKKYTIDIVEMKDEKILFPIEKIEIDGNISLDSVEPLRILTYFLDKKNISYQVSTSDGNPWNITQILVLTDQC